MESPAPAYKHFSADIRLELRVGGKVIDLASIGPDSVMARVGVELDRCEAEVVMTVDGDPVCWPVVLPNGAVPYDTIIETLPREAQR